MLIKSAPVSEKKNIEQGLDDSQEENIHLQNLDKKIKVVAIKGYCYIVLVIGFFIFYQQNPMYAIIIIGVFIVGYIVVKSRKSGSGIGGFLSGKNSQPNSTMDDLITLMMLQQLTNNSNSDLKQFEDRSNNDQEEQIERVKQEALALFDE